jgi:hypothetical protein
MRYILATGALAALVIGSSVGYAQEPSESLCKNTDAQVGSALENSSSTNRDEAVRERNSGRAFCNRGYYKIGEEHLEQALKLLGAKT